MKTDDKISYQKCLCGSYEVSNVGLKCEKGWEVELKMKANGEAKRKTKEMKLKI